MINSLRIVNLLFIIIIIAGCITIPKQKEKEMARYYDLPFSNDMLDKKMEALNNFLKENNLSDKQIKTATSILQAYEKIKRLNKGNASREDYIKSIQIFLGNIEVIEQQYLFSEKVVEKGIEKEIINDYLSSKKEIYEEYLADNLHNVISKCRELESRYGKGSLTPDIGIILVDSLSRNSMTNEALSTAKIIYNDMESRPDMIDLLSDIIEMQIKNGNIREATFFFEKLADLTDEKNNTYKEMQKILTKATQRNAILDTSVEKKITNINPEKTDLAEQKINNVKKLLSQNNFEGARLILLRWRLSAEEGPELDMIEEALKSVDTAEERYNNLNRKDLAILEDAKRKIEDEKYEEAISILKPLASDGSNFEAEKLKNLAIDKYINNERLKAAKLFIAANEEKNTKKKMELLLSSKSILDNLINSYPETPILEKLKRYIIKINEELRKLTIQGKGK